MPEVEMTMEPPLAPLLPFAEISPLMNTPLFEISVIFPALVPGPPALSLLRFTAGGAAAVRIAPPSACTSMFPPDLVSDEVFID